MKGKRRKFSGAFKAKVALEALKERESLAALSKRFEVPPNMIRNMIRNMISKWKQEFVEHSALVFEKEKDKSAEVDTEQLYARIGKLELEKDFSKKSLGRLGL